MARAPIPGRCKTRLATAMGDHHAARLCRGMLLDTLGHVERAWPPEARLVVMAAPEDDGVNAIRALAPSRWEVIAQDGADLGERLSHAFTALSVDAADGAVALVDADSPTAPWAEAAAAVAGLVGPRRACMGPCEDGGYWLLALTTIELRVLAGIAWSTDRVAAQTRERCRELGIALREVGFAYDVDVPSDLERLRAELERHPSLAPHTAAVLAGV
jgi:rSAM/selenodomain-associated transferase 1